MRFFTLLLFSLFTVACGDKPQSIDAVIDSGDVTAVRAKRNELNQEQRELREKIEKLDAFLENHEREDRPALVTASVVKDTVFKHFVEVQGNVDTDQNMVLTGEYSGVLMEIYVKEGQHVVKGQRLARIDDGGLASQVAQQEAQLALSETTFERQERLWNQKIGSEIQYLQAKTNFEAAQKATEQLRSQLRKTTLIAPFSGVVDDLIADPGQLVSPGQTQILRLVNLSNMYVKAAIPENFLKNVKTGSQVIVELPSIQEEYLGTVKKVSNYINPNTRTFEIQVDIPNKDGLVKPNLIATVKVNDYVAENAVVLPENILQENAAGETIAYLYKPVNDSIGHAKRIIIEVGNSYENNIEVKSGVKSGDTIIREGARNLRDGQKVIIKK